MKLQSEVTSQITEIQRLEGRGTSSLSDQQRALSDPLVKTFNVSVEICNALIRSELNLSKLLCVCVAVNRAAKGAEAGVHQTGGAAERSEEKQHHVGKETGVREVR